MKKEKVRSGEETIERRIFYAKAVYGDEEKQAVLRSLDNPWLASGPLVKEFEEKVTSLFGKKYGVAVNSGSSANLLALAALDIPEGREVITPACTFATTVSTIVQNNLVPTFVDVQLGKYTIDENLVREAVNYKTAAIFVPHLIGGVVDLAKLRAITDYYSLHLIDDSCDTFAPELNGEPVARYSDIVTTSFYGSHIITACGFGGMVMTDKKDLRDKLIVLRDWGRVGGEKEGFDDRFSCKVDGIPYDAKFLYGELGYNLKLNESGAAFGLEQLKRLPTFLETRRKNFAALLKYFKQYEKFFYLPTLIPGAETNWLAFPLTIKEAVPFARYDFLKHMESKGIQTRVLFSGNIVRHPVYENRKYEVASKLDNADYIMANGLLLGCHHGMDKDDVKYMTKSADEFLGKL